MVNQKVAPKNNGVTIPDGSVKGALMIGNINGYICNKNGSKLECCGINAVKYLRDSQYNLFSITKRQRNGWQLHGDNKAI
eukprot:7208416-Ditylum_brightwellii.AAC.2